MSSIPTNPFQIERLRDELARSGELSKFIRTYSRSYPEIKDQNTPIFWDSMAGRNHINKLSHPMANDKLEMIANNIMEKGGKILNVGCGSGDLEHITFLKLNIERLNWTGIDISTKSVNLCREEFPKATFMNGDIRKLKFNKDSFDVVCVLEVLEHIKPSEVFSALREVRRILITGGSFIVSVPLNENLEEILKKGNNPNAHVRDYTPNILKAELKIAGFEVKKEVKLFAFGSLYRLKSKIVKYILPSYKQPNSLLVISEKA
jgi:ubiquinone/menaquinone biosynthesis C-methylase UbiE